MELTVVSLALGFQAFYFLARVLQTLLLSLGPEPWLDFMIQIYSHWIKMIRLDVGVRTTTMRTIFFPFLFFSCMYVWSSRRYFGPAYLWLEFCQSLIFNLSRMESFPLSSCSCKLCDLRLRSSHLPISFLSLVLERRGAVGWGRFVLA
jgi:hypothetical protein